MLLRAACCIGRFGFFSAKVCAKLYFCWLGSSGGVGREFAEWWKGLGLLSLRKTDCMGVFSFRRGEWGEGGRGKKGERVGGMRKKS